MKNLKNNLLAVTVTAAVILGCANFADTTNNATTPATAAPTAELAKADISTTLFRGGVQADIIVIRPD